VGAQSTETGALYPVAISATFGAIPTSSVRYPPRAGQLVVRIEF
jgi:hypothetical protein